jgi:hypothetical protein
MNENVVRFGAVIVIAFGLALFAAMVLAATAGHRVGRARFLGGYTDEASFGNISAAVFALLGLLVAFSLSGATERLERRRQVLVAEANAIGTAYLRLDLLPAETQPALRATFKRYAASRAGLYDLIARPDAWRRELEASAAMQDTIWAGIVAATSAPEAMPMRVLVIPAVNEMIDITTTRSVSVVTHIPLLIFVTMLVLAVVCAWLAGYDAGGKPHLSRIHLFGFALVTSLTFYVILDLEFPRIGLVRMGAANTALVETAARMR